MNRASGSGLFIAGTDTGVGKTRVAAAVIRALREAGWPALGMKPVASGAEWHGSRLISDDTRDIAAASGLLADDALDDVTPYSFEPPISPHIAADRASIRIDIDVIEAAFQRLQRRAGAGGVVIVEGTGGWLAPISDHLTMADIAVRLKLPVVLVVGLRLGCLNHALLSAAAIEAAGLPLAGWVGNAVDPALQAAPENLATLAARLGARPLALLPHAPGAAVPAVAMRAFPALLSAR